MMDLQATKVQWAIKVVWVCQAAQVVRVSLEIRETKENLVLKDLWGQPVQEDILELEDLMDLREIGVSMVLDTWVPKVMTVCLGKYCNLY